MPKIVDKPWTIDQRDNVTAPPLILFFQAPLAWFSLRCYYSTCSAKDCLHAAETNENLHNLFEQHWDITRSIPCRQSEDCAQNMLKGTENTPKCYTPTHTHTRIHTLLFFATSLPLVSMCNLICKFPFAYSPILSSCYFLYFILSYYRWQNVSESSPLLGDKKISVWCCAIIKNHMQICQMSWGAETERMFEIMCSRTHTHARLYIIFYFRQGK